MGTRSPRSTRRATSLAEAVVVDASAILDVLARTPLAEAVTERLRDASWHAPAHFDAEILSALGRLARAGQLHDAEVEARLPLIAAMPVERAALAPLLAGAWARRHAIRFVDGLYVELAHQLGLPLVTTDQRLGRVAPSAEVITA
jgi:predicted nucleic acid-binding protein